MTKRVANAKRGRPRKWPSVKAMEKAIEAYFAECDSRTVPTVVGKGKDRVLIDVPKPAPYIVQGLALYLDLTMEGLNEYQKRPAYSEAIKKAKARIEVNKIQHLLDGDGYGPGYIFDLKNNYHWTDRQEITGPKGGPIQHDDLSGLTNAQLEKRLKLLRGQGE